ncbi:MAG TPA: hypothetical protein VF086_06585 [Propionibacteriaceae bacterium]
MPSKSGPRPVFIAAITDASWSISRAGSGIDHGGQDHQGLVSCPDRALRATTAVDDAKDSGSKIITWR